MIKLISMIFISLPILIFGFYFSYKESYRQKDLKEVYKAFNILKNEISYSFRTLADSFLSISTKVNKPVADIFLSISEDLKNDNELEFSQIFENSILKYSGNTYLSKSDIREFIDLSKTINHLDEKSIISSINIFMNYLETEIKTLEENSVKSKKTYQALAILSSLMIVIILL